MASIAQYLLHLAENPQAAIIHNRSADSADDLMRAFGLSEDQRAVVASGDHEQISTAISGEFPPSPCPGDTMSFQIPPIVIPRN